MSVQQSIADVSLDGLERGEPDFRVLYKYQRINDYTLDALHNGYLYFSSYRQLNDPFDPFFALIGRQVGSDEMAVMAEAGPKIFCVAEDQFNPLMWAHYGDSLAGMCVGYAVFTGTPRLFNPVRYVDKFVGEFSLIELFTMKSRHWSWESEWRACLACDEQKHQDIAHPVRVYLGPKCSTANMERVRAALPRTVKHFDILWPTIRDGILQYLTYEVEAVVKRYGGLPVIEDLIKNQHDRPSKRRLEPMGARRSVKRSREPRH